MHSAARTENDENNRIGMRTGTTSEEKVAKMHLTQIRTAVVGIGGRGSYMVRQVAQRPDACLAALCDTIVGRARYMAGEVGLPELPVFERVEDLLENVDVDAVIVTTPDGCHAEVVVPALQDGAFVFCEKPLEITIDRCRRIIEADDAAGGRTFVGFNLRYAPVYATIRRLVDEGIVGDILTIQADEFYNGGRTYFRRWNRLRSAGGGLWITKASHDFDLLAWFAGRKPLEVAAMAARTYYVPRPDAAGQCRYCPLEAECPDRAPREPSPLLRIREESGGEPYDLCLYNTESDTFDHGIAMVGFEGDVFATYTCNVVTGFSDRRLRISGTKATIDGRLRGKTVTVYKRDPSEMIEVPVGTDTGDGHGGADQHILDAFFAFVRGEAEPKCRPDEALIPVALGVAATIAGDEHRVVRLDEVLGTDDQPPRA